MWMLASCTGLSVCLEMPFCQAEFRLLASPSDSVGHVSSGCIYTGSHPDGGGFTEKDANLFSYQ